MSSGNHKISEKYDKIDLSFDPVENLLEQLFFKKRRKILWDKAYGKRLLDVGIGAGENFAYYPKNTQITALGFNQEMLQKARQKRGREDIKVEIILMNVQSLCYPDNSFDTVVGTFVFHSVVKPSKGLKELYRVCKPGGQVLLLENVLSSNPTKVILMRLLTPFISPIFSSNINKKTVKNLKACGFSQVIVDPASSGVIKIIQALK